MNPCKVLMANIRPALTEYLAMVLKFRDGYDLVRTASPVSQVDQLVKELHPDLILLGDESSGYEVKQAVAAIMRVAPAPILLFTDISRTGPEPVIDALGEGAVDFVDRHAYQPGDGFLPNKEVLFEKMQLAIRSKVRGSPLPAPHARARITRTRGTRNLVVVAIGVSLGGPSALQRILPALPKELGASLVVVQHMPASFTAALADRLNQQCAFAVREAAENDSLAPGVALVAPGGRHMEISPSGLVRLREPGPEARVSPSIDITFLALARHFGRSTLGIILTGMGKDGVLGIRAIKEAGGRTLAQDEATCLVFGMPKAAIELGAVDRVLPLDAIAEEIVAQVGALQRPERPGTRWT